MSLIFATLFRVFGHRICCVIPAWTAHVGLPWRPVVFGARDYLNLYNVIWRVQAAMRAADRS